MVGKGRILTMICSVSSDVFCIPSDSETDVALHLPFCGESAPRDDRAGGEGVQLPPQHLLLQPDRHWRQSERLLLFLPGSEVDHVLFQFY